jgi:hypothetical protein
MPYPTSGVGGSVKNGANVIANVDVWDLPQKAATKDTTSFGASGAYQVNTSILKSWTAKIQGRVDPGDTNGQLALINGLGSTFTFTFAVDSTHNWSGSGIVTGIHPKTNVNDVATIEYDITGSGPLTFT